MNRLAIVALAVLSLSSFATAEQASAPPAPQKPAAEKPPAVSEETRLRIENAALRQQLAFVSGQLDVCKAQVAPEAYKNAMTSIAQEITKAIAEFENANPGWTLDTSVSPYTPKRKGGD